MYFFYFKRQIQITQTGLKLNNYKSSKTVRRHRNGRKQIGTQVIILRFQLIFFL